MRKRASLPIALAAAVALAACGGGDDDAQPAEEASGPGASGCAEVAPPEPKEVEFNRPEHVLRRGEAASAAVETNCGSFTIELDTERSPKTANSFAFLAEEGFYDDTLIHRIAPGFVVQGGDPLGTGFGGPGYSVDEPPPARVSYLTGVVAMAKAADEPPGRSGSQFFVVTAPADAGLPPEYAILGQVGEGLDVVERIGQLGDASEQPTETVVIESVTIERS
ncbi:MAG TPA: peptidylprolyl isomerase [Solirubrobacterales bacterium]|nr:peptidylprolyl isomerase [Solirubrobacterales bacterium]